MLLLGLILVLKVIIIRVRKCSPSTYVPCCGALVVSVRCLRAVQDECATEVLAREEIRPAPKQLVRRVLSSLLHALSVRQSDVCLVRLFEGAIDFLRRYGARVFVSSVGDRMQVLRDLCWCWWCIGCRYYVTCVGVGGV